MKSVVQLGCLLVACSLIAACGGGDLPIVGHDTDVRADVKTDVKTDATDVTGERLPSDTPDSGPGDVPITGALTMVFADAKDGLGKPTAGQTVYNLVVSWNAVGKLKVMVLEDGQPREGVMVDYENLDTASPTLATLSATSGYTDGDGVAESDITCTVEKIGQFQVKVTVDGDDTVDPLYFNISCGPKDYIPLSVGYDVYAGAYPQLDSAEVRIFKQDGTGKPKCSGLAYNALPPATLSGGTHGLSDIVKFTQLPNLDKENVQNYTVVGLATHGTGPVQAWACDDVQGRVEWGARTFVELKLKDIPPSIKGSYEITSDFDLVSGLPTGIQTVVNAVIGFLQSPTGEVMVLICTAGGGNGSMSDFCKNLFTDPANPTVEGLTGTGSVVFQIIDAILIGLLTNNCPYQNDPTLCGKIWYTAKDVGEVLKRFQLMSTFTFAKDPDDNGDVMGHEVWHSVRLRWTLGLDCDPNDQNCGWQEVHFGDVSGMENTITGDFTAHVAPAWTISIDKHTLDIKYGALVDYALEKFLLPRLLGDGSDGLPAVDSFEAAIGSLLAGRACLADMSCCATFASQVASQTTGLLQNVVKGACDALISVGATYLRSQLVALDATPNNFHIGTKVPCNILDTNKDMKVDAFGVAPSNPQAPPGPCSWDPDLSFGGVDFSPNGIFWGNAK